MILIIHNISGELYTSEKTGSDEKGDGSEVKPFKTILHVSLRAHTSSEGQGSRC